MTATVVSRLPKAQSVQLSLEDVVVLDHLGSDRVIRGSDVKSERKNGKQRWELALV
jgi:hypothetical protein